ncbi:MAG: efflux RND transporter periplasmic adaptor subunit [Clostridiaceae bacterium]|jgi:HlyD family secretion protein|nr:efflux RND transporter periplasmic adaptor subunit [Clostridiaceae bacterium]
MKIKKRYIATGVIGLAILGAVGFGIVTSDNSVKYETQDLERCTITQTVEASGTINPVNTYSVGSTVSGLIKAIYVDYNSEVKKGQLLAEIDPRTFEAAVQQNQAQISNAQAALAKSNAQTVMARKTLTRYRNLYRKNFIAKSELDQAESDYLANVAEGGAARAQIAQFRASYKTAMTNLEYTKITAPVSGTIISREIDVGQPVAASFQAPELFTIAQDLTKMQIEVSVSEADIGKVKKGQLVTYTLDGYPDQTFTGKVTQVRLASTTTSNVVTYPVIVSVENKDLKLKPGMTANVSIITQKHENVLCAPNIALKFTPETNGKKYKNQGIWILEHHKPVRVDIKEGISDDSATEIISEKLKEGFKIIIGSNSKGTSSNSDSDKKSGKPPMRMF